MKVLTHQAFELQFLNEILPGYFVIFPLQDGMANVGIGALSAHVSKHRLKLRGLMQDTIRQHPLSRDRFTDAEMVGEIEGFGLPLGSRKVTMSGDHFMLCGDAASLIDPLTGEGIGQAMVSGRYAGWQARACFETNDFTAGFMRQYDDAVYQKFWRAHRKSYFIQKQLVTRPALINGLIETANSSRLANRVLSKLLA